MCLSVSQPNTNTTASDQHQSTAGEQIESFPGGFLHQGVIA
jgi:hypothetical protein